MSSCTSSRGRCSRPRTCRWGWSPRSTGAAASRSRSRASPATPARCRWRLRQDARAAAAEMMLAVERAARETADLVATVGRIEALPGAVNVIPSRARFTLDIRSPTTRSAAMRWPAGREFRGIAGAAASRSQIGQVLRRGGGRLRAVADRAARGGGRARRHPAAAPAERGRPRRPRHDRRCARSAMLFVRCKGGISHNPAESDHRRGRGRRRPRAGRLPAPLPAPRRTEDARCRRTRRSAAFLDAEREAQSRVPGRARQGPVRQPARRLPPPRRARGRAAGRLGFAVERHPVPEDQVRANGMVSATNLVVRRRFGDGGPVVALNAHGDVVPPGEGWTRTPTAPRSWTAGCTAAASRSRSRTSPPMPGRSGRSSVGRRARRHGRAAPHLRRGGGRRDRPGFLLQEGIVKPDLAIGAGFSYGVVTAHNGCLHLEVQVDGRSAHAAMPFTGVDALEAANHVLSALYAWRKSWPSAARRSRASAARSSRSG